MGGRAESPRGVRRRADALELSIERKVEIVAALFAVGNDVKTGPKLIVDGDGHRVGAQLLEVGIAKFVSVSEGVLKPSGKRVAANNRRAQRATCLVLSVLDDDLNAKGILQKKSGAKGGTRTPMGFPARS